ncbi:MAG TPA: FG-GAP repeat protein [Frankiaceae bacterium]|nr:FG-GAP repeat protein [Frankiaceae bacterium]
MRRISLLAPVLLVAALPLAPAAAAGPAIRGDFNGDGHVDLAIGAPHEAIGERKGAGAVNVLYGTATGFRTSGAQPWHQNVAGVHGGAEAFDGFGAALTSGDFDGDGYADLAIGAPTEDYTDNDRYRRDMGVTHVLYGSPSGLTAAGNQLFAGGESPMGGARGGHALDVGDFDDNGIDDLAIGVPGAGATGEVHVQYGSPNGLGRRAVFGAPNDGVQIDRYGWAIAAGDLDGNGVDDLAVGAPTRTAVTGGPVRAAGTVYVLFGSAGSGLASTGFATIDQNTDGVADAPEDFDLFGEAVATGDFDGDGKTDLAIGVPGEHGGTGAVHVLEGSASGPTGTDSAFLFRGGGGLPGPAAAGTGLGSILAAGNVDFTDDAAELVLGAPKDDVSGAVDGGSITIVSTNDGARLMHQNSEGVPGGAEEGDWFGHAVAVTARGDLLVGVPREDLGRKYSAGAVHAMWFGTTVRNVMLTQDTPGVPGVAENGDWFGGAVS